MTDTRPTLYVSRLLPDPIMSIVRERFQLCAGSSRCVCPLHRRLREGLCQADAAIVTLGDRIDAETIHAATRLKILANYAVGYNNIDLAAARQRGLIVTNTPDVLTDATADLTWALLLATARRVVEGDALIRSGRWTGWSPTQLLGAEVSGKTLGIIGMGRIGQAVAHRAVGFRMPVRYHTRQPLAASSLSREWEHRSLRDLLVEADVVTIHVPLTSSHPASDRRARIGLDAPHRLRSSIPLVARSSRNGRWPTHSSWGSSPALDSMCMNGNRPSTQRWLS